ncbi:MAG: helix-turn-helix domain-containing protein [Kiritimatiellae bacterium]|jgi:LacI family transcriptional regulator|nr:helix-turn-helix domain-containing protein [Kiritimatiellia bacterium]
MKRVRLQDLAEELDLSRATVCLALKGDPRVADDTAERVRKLAHTRGYQPDPVFSALGERRRQQPGEEIIAWVTSHPTESGWRGAITNCT